MNKKAGILTNEKGIIKKDGIYFSMTSPFAKDNLFHILFGANYICDIPYGVTRVENTFDACIMCYIVEGSMRVTYQAEEFIAGKNSIVFLDGRNPHSYIALEKTIFYWFHFMGNATFAYAELFRQKCTAVFSYLPELKSVFWELHGMLKSNMLQEDLVSANIHRILASLNTAKSPTLNHNSAVSMAKLYIRNHFSENISLDDMAKHCALSKYHLSRLFKQETGYSPHEYIVSLKIEKAKQVLSETDLSIEDIAFQTAFCSSANFIRTFKKKTGITPRKFREYIRSSG